MNIEIRTAVFSDIEEMSAVVDSAWHENYKDIFSSEQIAAYTGENRRKSFANLLNDGKDIYVALNDGRIAAVCAVQTCEEASFEGMAEIMLMYVHPDFQRRGIGEKLIFHAIDKMRGKGCGCAVLDTAEKNENARRFYEKIGFREHRTAVSRKFGDVTRVIYTMDLL